MKPFIAAAVAALMLAGCAGGAKQIADRDLQREADVACRAIGASLEALAPFRADLSEGVEATVNRIAVEAEPFCTGPNPPRTSAIIGRLFTMSASLIGIEGEI